MRIPPRTYTNVTATLALCLALGGSAYAAATITGADIRNDTVAGSDLRDGSLEGRDLADGTIAGRDLKDDSVTGTDVGDRTLVASDLVAGDLPAGPAGPAGPQGPAGTSEVLARRAVDVVLEPGDSETATASCPPGEIAVGGGAGHDGTPDDPVAIVFDEPLEADGTPPEDGEPATQWRARGHNPFQLSIVTRTMTVHVLCAER